ncbi:hypothetical protein OUZ56_005273 [Daphnia magna]|uniref:FLYWCH-type domain-containing protein n=2 Tax=Daphnia magna TaxID=35525 RepID=A0ABQ9YSB8_9CRUS|nr:hypothetical protein OUZ56_005273 [Daphnia magna]
MDCLSCSIKFKSREQKLQCIKCKKWQHRRCVTWKDTADYRRIKRCYIFKCSICTLQNIENELPSESGAKNFISSEKIVSEENTTEKVNSSPQYTPVIFVPPPLISPISSPIYVPPHMMSPLSSPFFGFAPSEEQCSGAGEERSNIDPESSLAVDNIQIEPSEQQGSPSSETEGERSNIDPEPAASQPLQKKFKIVESGSMKKSNILLDGSGFRYGVKRKNQSGVTWRCNFRGLKGKKSCTATVKEVNGRFIEGPAAHSH